MLDTDLHRLTLFFCHSRASGNPFLFTFLSVFAANNSKVVVCLLQVSNSLIFTAESAEIGIAAKMHKKHKSFDAYLSRRS
jgi:hypothetical protein